MSPSTTTRCPDACALEGIAAGHVVDPLVSDHLKHCEVCRTTLDRIRADNEFLGAFAADGAFPAATRPESSTEIDIPGYQIVREILRGGQGVVYQAIQQSTGRPVAIKVMKQGPFATFADRARFDREIEILGRLNHPNIVTIHDAGVVAGFHYFVMNYIDGGTFDEALVSSAAGGRVDLARALVAFIKVCDAVHAAHLRGVIHRDLKPGNIRVDARGEPFVLDFGLAKAVDAMPDSAMTQSGQFVGSVPWASPEQMEGAASRIDLRTDVYSLGVILFQLVSGALPFNTPGNLHDIYHRVLHDEPPPPSTLAREGIVIEEALDTIVLRCLSKQRDRRYQSAAELSRDLKRHLAGEPIEAKRDSALFVLRRTLQRYRLRVAVAGVLVVLLGGFGIMMALMYRHSTRLEQQAVQSALSLARQLSISNIERGRLLVRSGNVPSGEQLIWPEWRAAQRRLTQNASWPPDEQAYWALWELYARSPCRRTIHLPQTERPRLAINHERTLMALGRRDGGVELWKLPEARPFQRLKGGDAPATELAFDPTGDVLFAGDVNGGLSIWNLASGERTRQFAVSDCPIRHIRFLAGGRTFAVNDEKRRAFAWTIDGKPAELAFLNRPGILAMDTDISGRRLGIGCQSGGIFLFEPETGRVSAEVPSPPGVLQDVTILRFSPDGERFAAGRADGTCELWSSSGQQLQWRIRLHQAAALTLDFDDSGSQIASAGRDRTVHVLDANDGRIIHTLAGHAGVMTGALFFDDARRLLSASLDGTARIWDLRNQPAIRELTRHPATAFHLAFSPDGRSLASSAAAGDARVRVCDTETGKMLASLEGHDGIVAGVAFHPEGDLLATAGFDREIRLWDLANNTCRAILKGHDNFVEAVAFCLDGRRLVSVSDDQTVRLWDVDAGLAVSTLRGHTERCPAVAVSPDGRTIASCSLDKTIRLWSAEDGQPLGTLEGHRLGIRSISFTPDGAHLVSAGDETAIRIWNVANRTCIGTLNGNDQDVFCVAISPDGRFAASTTRGGTIQLWSLAQRLSLATLYTGRGSVFAAAFSPDGKHLAFCDAEGRVRLIDLTFFDAHMQGNADLYPE